MAAAKKEPWKTSTSSGHITNLRQSILETFDIYGLAYSIQIKGFLVKIPWLAKLAEKKDLLV
jgi:hypothetical protein